MGYRPPYFGLLPLQNITLPSDQRHPLLLWFRYKTIQSWFPVSVISEETSTSGSEMITEPEWNPAGVCILGEISDFAPSTHAQSNILHTKYADKTDY